MQTICHTYCFALQWGQIEKEFAGMAAVLQKALRLRKNNRGGNLNNE
jgi:hypothetical protein